MNRHLHPSTGDSSLRQGRAPRGSGFDFAAAALWAGFLATLSYGVVQVVRLRWICDDAFLSFRFAANLAHGHGLVYNVGQRVEGYTNFLWTVLVAGAMRLGIDPVIFVQATGTAAYIGTVAVALALSCRMETSAAGRWQRCLPVTAILLLLHRDMHVWATGGLETSLVTLLVFSGCAALVTARTWRAHLAAGLLFVLAALARPDALLFAGAAFAALLAARPLRLREPVAFALPLLLIFVPYWLLRWSYYGYFFPNTYYAKSGGLAYYSQGLKYLALYLRANFVLLLVPVAIAHLAWLRRSKLFGPGGDASDRAARLALFLAALYVFYAVRVGGDFMFARFFIPVTPLAFLILELWVRRAAHTPWVRLGATALLAVAVLARHDPFPTPQTLVDGVADERGWYPESWRQDRQEFGRTLRRCLEGTDARLAFLGTYAAAAYYAGLPYALEADAGLTDTALAHRPVGQRGRPGHEKPATIDDLARRRINFLLHLPRPATTSLDRLAEIRFGYRTAYIVTYENAVMQHLKQFPDVSFVDFPAYLDEVIPRLPYLQDEEFLRLYRFYRSFYFDVNDDPERAAPFEARLRMMGRETL